MPGKYRFVCDGKNLYRRVLEDVSQHKKLYRVYVDLPCDSACIIKAANCFSDVSYAVSHDGNLLASFDVYEPFVKLWNLATGNQITLLNTEGFEISFSANDKELYTRTSNAIVTWNVEEALRYARKH